MSESKDAARRERKRRFVDGERESQKKSAAADAVVVVAAPITPLKKGEEENARVSHFFLSLSLSVLCARSKIRAGSFFFCFASHWR